MDEVGSDNPLGREAADEILRLRGERDRVLVQRDLLFKQAQSALAQRDRLREALERAERWFRDYARQHLGKGTSDGNMKAATNEERADYLAEALRALTPAEVGEMGASVAGLPSRGRARPERRHRAQERAARGR